MDSVFIVSPPSFTIKEISDILDIEFSMNGTVTELYSDRDQNFHFSNGQDDLIIKVSNLRYLFGILLIINFFFLRHVYPTSLELIKIKL